MNNEQLTAEVVRLEHYLFDVWEWRVLYGHAERRYVNTQGQALTPWSAEPLQWQREGNAELERHLVDKYAQALQEITGTLTAQPTGVALVPLLSGAVQRLTKLCTVEGLTEYWLPQLNYDPTPLIGELSADKWSGWAEHMRKLLGSAAPEVCRYIRMTCDHLARYIEGRSAEVEQGSPAQKIERIQWKGSAAKLAFLFQSLHLKGWADLPLHKGRPNYTALARTLHQVFDIRTPDGQEVELSSLIAACKPSGDNAETTDGSVYFRIKPRQ